MGIEKLQNKAVFLDTAPLIYFIESNSVFQPVLKKFFASFDSGKFSIITSSLTLLEVLVQPVKMKRPDLVAQYKQILLETSGIEVFEMNSQIAEKAATLRAEYGLKTPDAIQVATAVENNADYFFTNDIRLKAVKEINILTPTDL